MKYRKRLPLILALVIFLGSWLFILKEKRLPSTFQSYQSVEKGSDTTIESLILEEDQIKRNIAKLTDKKKFTNNPKKTKKNGANPIISFLNQDYENFNWSPEVYGIEAKKFEEGQFEIIGKHEDLVVIKSSIRPSGGNHIVFNRDNKKLGLYLERVIVFHKKSSELEEYITRVCGTPPYYLNGIYFIEIVDFGKSQEVREKISADFKNANVELDISYGRVQAN